MIRIQRKRRGLTVAELAGRVMVSASGYGRCERGDQELGVRALLAVLLELGLEIEVKEVKFKA